MNRSTWICVTIVALFGTGLAQAADDLQQMAPELSQLFGQYLSDLFKKEHQELQANFDVDPSQASGVHAGQDGIICVPVKGLKERNPDPAVETENGAGLCMLFLSPCFTPMVDGKPVDDKKLRRIKFDNGQGAEREAICLVVTVKHVAGDDWQLFAFGSEKSPVVKSQFGESSSGGDKALTLQVRGAKDMKATLELTLHSKYSTSFAIATK